MGLAGYMENVVEQINELVVVKEKFSLKESLIESFMKSITYPYSAGFNFKHYRSSYPQRYSRPNKKTANQASLLYDSLKEPG